MRRNLSSELAETLEKERKAIIAGKFAAVDELAPLKQGLFEELIVSKPKPSELKSIQRALNQNQILFSSAIEGVKSARLRLEALREVREGLRIYDQSGRLAQVNALGPGLSKRT